VDLFTPRSGQLGSNLIPRCYSSSEKNLKDAVLLPILLRQAVAMLDGVELLLTSGAVHAANLQMRALFSMYQITPIMSDSGVERLSSNLFVLWKDLRTCFGLAR
jgi:hypothetical protein